MKYFYGLIILFSSAIVLGQTRIDSSFAFGTNPAKKYSIYIPSNYNAGVPNELMVGFHPFNVSVWDAEAWCDTLIQFSESNDLILVCPDGGTNGNITDAIDYGFTTALLDSMKLWYSIDTNRIYAMGFSMGGVATYEYGLQFPEVFGGYLPIGAAINGTGSFSSDLPNSGQKPFYLVHGANDAPNTRYWPAINGLNANCAIVNSMLMTGVGHTINFPNRNQILSDAYQWIDSVNVTPRSGGFNLISPISFSSLDVKGFSNLETVLTWESNSIADTCGVMKYEFMLDVSNGSFTPPIYTRLSDNNGEDTTLTFTNHELDSLLNSFGVLPGASITLKWAVRSNLFNQWYDTAKAFIITVNRGTVGFKSTDPFDSARETLVQDATLRFEWTAMNHSAPVTYALEIDSVGADFASPIVTYVPANGALNNFVVAEHEQLYYDFLMPDNAVQGDSIMLSWRAVAMEGTHIEYSNPRTLTLIKDSVGVSLKFPLSESELISQSGFDYSFTWDSVGVANITYEFLIDTTLAGLTGSPKSYQSDNGGNDAQIFIPYERMDSIAHHFGINYTDTLKAYWTVKVTHPNGFEYALEPFLVYVHRDVPIGIEQVFTQENIAVFPNPSKDQVTLQFEPLSEAGILRILDAEGKLVFLSNLNKTQQRVELDIHSWEPGIYQVQFQSGKSMIHSRIVKVE